MAFKKLSDINDTEISKTFWKGLSVLEAFDNTARSMTASEIAAKTGLDRAVARRLVRTLEQSGYLVEERGKYQMTVRVLRLTYGFTEGHGLAQVIQPILRVTSQDIAESVSFSMRDELESVYVAHAFLPSKFTLNRVTLGTRVPLPPTAVGQSIMANMPEEEVLEMLDMYQQQPTLDKREIDRDTLLGNLPIVQQKGYAFAEGGYIKGISALALPVFKQNQQLAGAVSIIFQQGQHSEADLIPDIIPRLRQCAADVGAAL